MLSTEVQQKYEQMQAILRSLERVGVAYSGGVDSTLVLRVAVDVLGKDNVVAVTGRSPSMADSEFEEAKRLALQMGCRHVVIETNEMDDPEYCANPPNRCYHCKQSLFRAMQSVLREHGISVMVTGTNVDDHQDWRPGIAAGDAFGVRSPAEEAGLAKSDIRELSRELNLPTYDKPAAPCLASRIPYGEPITVEKLKMVERAEAFLKSLGFCECRVRHHGSVARIEVRAEDLMRLMEPSVRTRIDQALREIGYTYVAVDLRGFRSGSLNEAIQRRE